ncbi:flagellar biosynthetic protein FliO [Halobacillus litoralis]|uniref:flagellar biosynthetic protein FliO n=1 Tax=Halobacillus litoralis TaxID=45668 RepID=UPI001CD41031|nr:flagellar biosynthetic protein FliO [Halobacillus litoralis]MCA0969129.1 flagellar biosynthetic protein FliO [Halobacillus litoralis]
MKQMVRIILVLLTMNMLFPVVGQASPSSYECIVNPDQKGCSSNDPAEDSNESPAGTGEEAVEAPEPSLVGTIVRLVAVLLLVLGLIYGLLKFFNQKNKLFSRNRTMENLGGMNLAPNRSIQAVRVGEQVFILGVGDTVQMVTEVTDEKTKTSLLNREDNQQKPASFNNLLKPLKASKESTADSATSTAQFQELFENQLNDMKKKTKEARRQKQEDQHHE